LRTGEGQCRQCQVLRGVGKADLFDHVADEFVVIGQQTFFDFVSEEVAEDAAKIFVARKRQEGAGIRDHADEAGQQATI